MSRRKAPPDQRADTRGGQWAGIPHAVLDAPAYRSLGLMARAVLVEIVRRFNGYNNGDIALSFDQVAAALGNSNRRAIAAAFAELVDRGLVAVGAPADRRHHRARAYRLTFVSTGKAGQPRPATNDYIGWKHGDDALPSDATLGDDALPCPSDHGDDASPRIVTYLRKSAIS